MAGRSWQNIYNYDFQRLSDYLIPFDVFIETVRFIEGCPYYNVSMKDDKDAQIDCMCAPYPYIRPCCPEYVNANFDDMDDNTLAQWLSEINVRVGPILHFAIGTEILNVLESSGKYGAIMEMTTGYSRFIDYTNVKGLTVTICQPRLPDVMSGLSGLSKINDEIALQEWGLTKSELAERLVQDNGYTMYYNFNYRKIPDAMNPLNEPIVGTVMDYSLIPPDRRMKVAEKVIRDVDDQKKLILVI